MSENTPKNPSILEGKRAWIITSGQIGDIVQCQGVVEALGLNIEIKTISPRAPWRYLAPWGPVSPGAGIGKAKGQLAGPLPEIIIATGRQSVPYIRALTKLGHKNTLTVFLKNPVTRSTIADVIWVSEHDRAQISGDNIISTLTSPNRITPTRLARARKNSPLDKSSLPSPCITILLGGKNAVYEYSTAAIERFVKHLTTLAKTNASFLITPSRRTDARLVEEIRKCMKDIPHHMWDGTGDNPYFDYLALCDALIVTADSINMTSEAVATGKPVYVFEPDGGSPKFSFFHEQLQKRGITRTFEGVIDTWNYEPTNATTTIACEIADCWQQKCHF